MASVATLRTRHGAGPLVLAAALPFIFLHLHYQPSVSVGQVTADLSDVAVAAVVLAGAVAARADTSVFRCARALWIAWAALALAVVGATVYGALRFGAYPAGTHATTAAKWLEYMLLAPAVAAIARNAADLIPAAVVLVFWGLAATVVGILQFVGLLGDLDHTPAGRRKPSFLGYHDFSALSAAILALAFLILARGAQTPGERRFVLAAGLGGAIGLVLGGAFDAVLGLVLAATAIVLMTRPRDRRGLVVIVATILAVSIGTVAIRSQAVADGLKFLGVKPGNGGASAHVQSYRQRVLLAYIGGRIFIAHPVFGVGWEGSSDEFAYSPFLADARRRFAQPPEAFPSPRHPWGVQNAYVQSLADMGVAGLVVFLAALVVPLALAWRARTETAVAGAGLVLVAAGVWNGYGLIAGVPLDALTWIGVGVIASGVCSDRRLHSRLTTGR